MKKAVVYLTLLSDQQITDHQFKCLLGTANDIQLDGLCEFIYNAISGRMHLDSGIEKLVKRNIKLLTVLTNRKQNSYRKRIQIIRKHIRVIGRIVKKLNPYIKKVLKKVSQ